VTFYYAARASDGARVAGSIEAQTRRLAARHLRARSLFVTTLETTATPRGLLASFGLACRRSTQARAAFFRSFATLIGAGIAVRRALDTLVAQCADAPFAETLRSIGADVEGGAALSAAMQRHSKDFSGIAIAMVAAGELGGNLDDALRGLAELEERDRSLRKRIGAALAYPCIVTVAAAALVVFLVANTMPAFASLFAQMHVALPLSTRCLIALGRGAATPVPWSVAALVLGPCAFAIARYKRSDAPWAAALDRLRLRLPLLGPIAVKSTVARFARTFGALLHAGVDVVAALEAAAAVVEGAVYRTGLRRIVEELRRGETLTAPFENSGLFDGTFLQLLSAGEESGAADAMLLRLAHYYDLDVETALATLAGVVEPLLICGLGAAIGTIVASIFIPLYSMIGNIT
jgi:type IV pilus assembly protein PilC